MRRLSLILAGLALGAASPGARACGPFFPNRYLDATTEQLLSAPEAYFADEVWRLAPAGAKRVEERRYDYWSREDAPSPAERTARVDAEELASALRAGGRSGAEVTELVAAYRRAREGGGAEPAGLPEEFALYLRGARAWKTGDIEAARASWDALCGLPFEQRKARSVWAAYMLGRSHLDLENGDVARDSADEENALRWFQRAKRYREQGCADALDLTGEAKGWMARLKADRADFCGATHLYLERLAEGDDTAVQSLRRVARRAATETWGEELATCANDRRTREVVVAWLLARGGTIFEDNSTEDWAARAREWALAIRRAKGSDVHGADRLAWLAYEGGLFGLAADWLELAPGDSAEAAWLRAKLALREGKLEDGARWLEAALARGERLAPPHRKLVYAELGRVRLAQDKPGAALEAWLAGGHWEDAAFVAERVLTVDELAEWVDAGGLKGDETGECSPKQVRCLLARRLARAGEEERALKYFPVEQGEPFAAYLADVRVGFDVERAATERVSAFWRAARTMREQGMELIGTELEPDWAISGGSFDLGSDAQTRTELPAMEGGVFAPTELEKARLEAHAAPERRFHYRYRAAELAWWAASLSPNDSEETARMLWRAGGWLKARDPKAAEPFYQALVIRCGRTALGREATRLRWFPAEEPAGESGPAVGVNANADLSPKM